MARAFHSAAPVTKDHVPQEMDMDADPVEVLKGGMQCTVKDSAASGADGASLNGTCSNDTIDAETALDDNSVKVVAGRRRC